MVWLRWLIVAFALVANTAVGNTNGGAGAVTTPAIDTTGANLIVLAVSSYAATSEPTISDSKSNTWSQLTIRSAGDTRFRLFYCAGPTVGSGHTFTVSPSAGNPYQSFCVGAFSGAAASTPFDQQNGATATGTSLATGSVTPSEDNELVIAGLNFAAVNTISVNGGFTISDQINYSASVRFGSAMAYLIQTSLAAANPSFSWSTSTAAAAGIATFKAAAGGGSTYTFSASDNIGVADTFSRTVDTYRALSESIGVTDTFDRQADAFRTVTDAVGIADSADRLAEYFRSLSDDLGVSDSVDRQADANRIFSDDIGISELFDRLADAFRSISDAFGIADTFERAVAIELAIADAIGLADSVSRQVDYLRGFTDDLGLSDDFQRQVDYYRIITDAIGVLKALVVALNGVVITTPDVEEEVAEQDIEEDLYDYILACGEVTALIGTRLYALEAPKEAVRPYIVYEILTRDRDDAQQGETGLVRMIVQYDCQAEGKLSGYDTVRAIEESLRSRFYKFYHRAMGTSFVQSAEITDCTDDDTPPVFADAQGIYHSRVDLEIWYEEPVPV